MDGHAGQVDVVQKLVVELDRHAGGEEHHNLLVSVLLQEGEEEEEPLVTRTHHIPGSERFGEGQDGEELIETLTLVLVLLQWPYLWYPVKTEYNDGSKQSVTQYTRISLLQG